MENFYQQGNHRIYGNFVTIHSSSVTGKILEKEISFNWGKGRNSFIVAAIYGVKNGNERKV